MGTDPFRGVPCVEHILENGWYENRPKSNISNMKKYISLLPTAAFLCIAVSCVLDPIYDFPHPSAVPAQISAELVGTKAVETLWNKDKIGVIVTESPSSDMTERYRNVEYVTASTGTAAEFTAAINRGGIYFRNDETVKFSAYAPYFEGDATLYPGNDGEIAVSTLTQPDAATAEKVDYLFAAEATASKAAPMVKFAFSHIMSRIILNVKVSTADGFDAADIDKGVFELNGLVHEGMVNVLTGKAAASGQASFEWSLGANAQKSAPTAGKHRYVAVVLPQSVPNGLTLKAVIDGQTFSIGGVLAGELEAGKSYTYDATLKRTGLEFTGSTILPWEPVDGGSGDATMEP